MHFDASLTAARIFAGVDRSESSLTPRIAVQRFLNPNPDSCTWEPQYNKITFNKPIIQFWSDDEKEHLRYRKYQPSEGLITVLVRDNALGINRERMPKTILDLNSDDKLKTFEAIGQFGHGGSSALAFCELCLILTQPRFDSFDDRFYWTLIFPEPKGKHLSNRLYGSGFVEAISSAYCSDIEYPCSKRYFPGTSIWHFGYTRGSWLKTAARTHQDTPAGRLGRLFFSYPLPFEIRGELARSDTPSGMRTIKGAYFRLLEDRSGISDVINYRSGEKSETLIVEGLEYGRFSMFVFVLKGGRDQVRNYVDQHHPIVITLNGQNHGEISSKLLVDANLPESSSSSIIEIRLDGLEEEALSNIISNSRERPKNSPFTDALKERVRVLLEEDESLAEIERKLQEEKAKQSSDELNDKITRFLSSILSDAVSEPGIGPGDGPGTGKSVGKGNPRPEIPANEPPRFLEFLSTTPVFVPQGTARIVKFKSDARPPKYSFHGDNPRCFAKLECSGPRMTQVAITGKADIDGRGYSSVTLSCADTPKDPVTDNELVGSLEIIIQTTDGRVLNAKLSIGVSPKPTEYKRKRRQSVKPRIILCAPDGADREHLANLLVENEDKIISFGTRLEEYRDALEIENLQCAYWGDACTQSGESILTVEVNIAHPRIVSLLRSWASAEERVRITEKVMQDIVLDCYQHSFRLDDVPEIVHEQVVTESENLIRASEICLNYDKILRTISQEK